MKNIYLKNIFNITFLASFILFGCQEDDQFGTHNYALGELLFYDNNIDSSLMAFNHAALLDDLNLEGDFTVFAPNDEAWVNFVPTQDIYYSINDFHHLNSPFEGNRDIENIMNFMVVPGKFENIAGMTLETKDGEFLTISEDGKTVSGGSNGSAKILRTISTEASNGSIYVIDNVLLTPKFPSSPLKQKISENPNFSTFLEALEKSKIGNNLLSGKNGAYSVVVPNNQAFTNFFEDNGISGINDLTQNEVDSLVRIRILVGFVAESNLDDNFPSAYVDQDGKQLGGSFNRDLIIPNPEDDLNEELTGDVFYRGNNGWLYESSSVEE